MTSGSPTDFLKGVVGKRVVVRLTSGVDYRGMSGPRRRAGMCVHVADEFFVVGILSCLDGYMNIALEQTEEHVNGRVTNKYGDAFIRGNNGQCCFRSSVCLIANNNFQYCTSPRPKLYSVPGANPIPLSSPQAVPERETAKRDVPLCVILHVLRLGCCVY